MNYTLGIDIGTTSVKTILISSDGIIVDEKTESHNLLSLYTNWAEEDVGIWWDNTIKTVKAITDRNIDKVNNIVAIGVSGMVPAIVLLDDKGNVLRNTIQQNDARSIEQIECIKSKVDQEEIFNLTGGYTNQQHVLPRILWVKENEKKVWNNVSTVFGSYDYIVYKLTGVLSIEKNWAVESGFLNIKTGQWIDKYFDMFDIPKSIFPKVNESISIVGETRNLMDFMGLPDGIPVIAGSADHVASTLAAGIIDEGDLLIKFGGAGDILYCINDINTSKDLFFDSHIVPGKSLLNGCMASSGSLVKWFIKDIADSESKTIFEELDKKALKIAPASDGLIILPYFLGEKTPIFDVKARGVMFGLTLSHTKTHIFRAILESVIYGFRHHVEVIKNMGYKPRQIMATNGGAKSSFWCQIAADVLGEPIRSYPTHPGSALGVAFLAAMSVGMFNDFSDINKFLSGYKMYYPNAESSKIYNKSYSIYRNLYKQLRQSFDDVYNLYR